MTKTITERLQALAEKTERRVGLHPDVDTIRAGIKTILDLEAQAAIEEAPKPVAKRAAKKDQE